MAPKLKTEDTAAATPAAPEAGATASTETAVPVQPVSGDAATADPAIVTLATGGVASADKLFTQAEVAAIVAAALEANKPQLPPIEVVFHEPSENSDALAMAEIRGAFRHRDIVISGIDLKLDKRGKLAIYMPGFGLKRAIMGVTRKLDTPIRLVSGATVTHDVTPGGARDMDVLTRAVARAWDEAYTAVGDAGPFERPIPLAI